MLFAGISSWGRKVGRRLELLTINDRLQITKTIKTIIIAVIHRPQLTIITPVVTLSSLTNLQ